MPNRHLNVPGVREPANGAYFQAALEYIGASVWGMVQTTILLTDRGGQPLIVKRAAGALQE